MFGLRGDKRWCSGLLWVSLLSLAACDNSPPERVSASSASVAAVSPAPVAVNWAEHISAHSGAEPLSRDAKLRIEFVHDVILSTQVGQNVNGVLTTTPPIVGQLAFQSPRLLVLTPAQPLPFGQDYRVRLDTQSLLGFPAAAGVFEFIAQVMLQDFKVKLTGFRPDPATATALLLTGELETADRAETAALETVLSAEFQGQTRQPSWQHAADGKSHTFVFSGLQRAAQAQPIRLRWQGQAIGVKRAGELQETVPALGAFVLQQATVMQAEQQTLSLSFSEPLHPQQNLAGLIRLGSLQDQDFTSRIESNRLLLYPRQPLSGAVTLVLDAGIQNQQGIPLGQVQTRELVFNQQKPEVRFTGNGVILPDNPVLSIPFEVKNARRVQVMALRVYADNIGQFLQTNNLSGDAEMQRVGRYLWRKTIDLPDGKADQWTRYALDASELLRRYPGSLFRLRLSLQRQDAEYNCPPAEAAAPLAAGETRPESPLPNEEDWYTEESSGWEGIANYYQIQEEWDWDKRDDPCANTYYQYNEAARAERNFLASNIGLLAKRGDTGSVLVYSTDLRTAGVLPGVSVELRNYQNQVLTSAVTDAQGRALLLTNATPFYLLARKDSQRGYLKLNAGNALAISHFDVSGETAPQGIKGYLYGERGVWRPGDDIHLTLVVEDKTGQLPPQHPVSLRLFNPQDQLTQTLTNNTPVNGFYTFTLHTDANAETGNWTAKALLGNQVFTKTLKIETVMPNRLKLGLELGSDALYQASLPQTGKLAARWLHGASAAGLKAEVALSLSPTATQFGRYADFIFDDPARSFASEAVTVFEGPLDAQGEAEVTVEALAEVQAAGMLNANFTLRVFEESGAFSSSQFSLPYHPYANYVGIKLPKGDQTRNMLLTDTPHTVQIASLDAYGEPSTLEAVQVTLYKLEWKWWWDKSGDELAEYASAESHNALQQDTVATRNGQGSWTFQIKYPEWGRYLIRACDSVGGHCTGKTLYVDWPGWAGRAQGERSADSASTLALVADKPRYQVGETAVIQLPAAGLGRALVSLETGHQVLSEHWLNLAAQGTTRLEIPLLASMAPNVYVHVTVLQPHQGKQNDLPIRLYGVVPLLVEDPATHLQPQVLSDAEWRPQTEAQLTVSEAQGRAMTYTLAVVDEGLLDLTRFKTPDLHRQFYKKEALGVSTWDLFDEVVGAYGGALERLLALGGDGEAVVDPSKAKEKRFPPVVKFFGPFALAAGEQRQHQFTLPPYLGAVRVMVVAGSGGAYGWAEKSVWVRDALNLLATVPRVLGPNEEVTVPVTVFATQPEIQTVTVQAAADAHFEILGAAAQTLTFQGAGEQMAFFRLKVRPQLGQGQLRFSASSGTYRSDTEIHLEIRSSNPRLSTRLAQAIAPGASWQPTLSPQGLPGTQQLTLEVSAALPLNLEQRLAYLISYPHGCLEQVTSALFPQLALPRLLALNPTQSAEIERNIKAGIARLQTFQTAEGSFSYWSGSNEMNAWVGSYAGHFLLLAQQAGYQVPAALRDNWLKAQRARALEWTATTTPADHPEADDALSQSYRLYTLALAGVPELGAMNRLRQQANLAPLARWQLAATYALIGLPEAAQALVAGLAPQYPDEAHPEASFSSPMRDQALILQGLLALDQKLAAKTLADELARQLSQATWQSTHSVAFALRALAAFIDYDGQTLPHAFQWQQDQSAPVSASLHQPLYRQALSAPVELPSHLTLHNQGSKTLYAAVVSSAIPAVGEETSSAEGLALQVTYQSLDGQPLAVEALKQSLSFKALVEVRNTSGRDLSQLALTHLLPAGWEIYQQAPVNPAAGASGDFAHQEVRDDRIYTYFSLKAGETRRYPVHLNAAYLGRYYLPGISVEAMYDAKVQARIAGRWVSVIQQ